MLINKHSICYVNKGLKPFLRKHCGFDLRKLAKEAVCHHSAGFPDPPLAQPHPCWTEVGAIYHRLLSARFRSPSPCALAPLAASPAVLLVFTFKSSIVLSRVQIRSAGNEKSPQFRPQP